MPENLKALYIVLTVEKQALQIKTYKEINLSLNSIYFVTKLKVYFMPFSQNCHDEQLQCSLLGDFQRIYGGKWRWDLIRILKLLFLYM